jgi:hypothetical protein
MGPRWVIVDAGGRFGGLAGGSGVAWLEDVERVGVVDVVVLFFLIGSFFVGGDVLFFGLRLEAGDVLVPGRL